MCCDFFVWSPSQSRSHGSLFPPRYFSNNVFLVDHIFQTFSQVSSLPKVFFGSISQFFSCEKREKHEFFYNRLEKLSCPNSLFKKPHRIQVKTSQLARRGKGSMYYVCWKLDSEKPLSLSKIINSKRRDYKETRRSQQEKLQRGRSQTTLTKRDRQEYWKCQSYADFLLVAEKFLHKCQPGDRQVVKKGQNVFNVVCERPQSRVVS